MWPSEAQTMTSLLDSCSRACSSTVFWDRAGIFCISDPGGLLIQKFVQDLCWIEDKTHVQLKPHMSLLLQTSALPSSCEEPCSAVAFTALPALLLQPAAGTQAACSCQRGLSLGLSIDVTLVLLLMSSGADYAKQLKGSSMTQIIWVHCLYIIKPNPGEIWSSVGFTMCIPGKYWTQKEKEGGMTAGILSFRRQKFILPCRLVDHNCMYICFFGE